MLHLILDISVVLVALHFLMKWQDRMEKEEKEEMKKMIREIRDEPKI